MLLVGSQASLQLSLAQPAPKKGFPFDRHPMLPKILEWQDARVGDSLILALNDSSALVRSRAALALASVQDANAVEPLIKLLADAEPTVRRYAAFALGQTTDSTAAYNQQEPAEAALLKRFDDEQDLEVKRVVLEALGKCGGQATALKITNNGDLLKPTVPKPLLQAALMTLAQIGMKNILTPAISIYCLSALQRPEAEKVPEIGFAASYMFARAPIELWRVQLPALSAIVTARKFPSEVQMNLARAFAKTRNAEYLVHLKNLAKVGDWRVRVECARAAGTMPSDSASVVEFLVSLVADKSSHVKITAMKALERMALASAGKMKLPTEFVQTLKARAVEKLTQAHERGAMVRLIATQEPSWAWKNREKVSLTDDIALIMDITEAIGYANDTAAHSYLQTRVQDFVNVIADPSFVMEKAERRLLSIVAASALRGLTTVWQRRQFDKQLDKQFDTTRYLNLLSAALQSPDVGLAVIAAQAFADTGFVKFKSVDALTARVLASKPERDLEVIQEIMKTLTRLKNGEATAFVTKSLTDSVEAIARASAVALEMASGQRTLYKKQPKIPIPLDITALRDAFESQNTVQINTKHGTILLQLDVENTPLTSLNFLKLVKAEKFDAVAFHRVVSNFVIQGGDGERSDGYGSAGYMIRSEFVPVPFERGVVGMASAGKDTESCQWFIMHSPAPHLDGRYTPFARVVSGIDVVDKILAFDEAKEVWVKGKK